MNSFTSTWSRGLDLKLILSFVKIQMICESIWIDNSVLLSLGWFFGVYMLIFDGVASLGLLGVL